MRIKAILTHFAVGLLCLILGMMLNILLNALYKKDMINFYSNTKDYVFEFSLKNMDLLKLNTYEEIRARVEAGVEEVIIDLEAPPVLKELFNKINRERVQEKRKILKGASEKNVDQKIEI